MLCVRAMVALVAVAVALAAVAAAAAAGGVAAPERARNCTVAPAGTFQRTLAWDGLNRTFTVHVPTNLTLPLAPVVMLFHGQGGTAAAFFAQTGAAIIAEEGGFIAVLADGWENSWNAGDCCGPAQAAGVDDVGFVRAMVDYLDGLVCIDRARVFAGGFSNGAILSYVLACVSSDLIRAMGSMAGARSTDATVPCNAQVKPIPFIHLHGTADPTLPYAVGEYTVNRYVDELLECPSPPVRTFENGTATCESWFDCKQGSQGRFCTIEGLTHKWTGCYTCGGTVTQDINTTREMWKFFTST